MELEKLVKSDRNYKKFISLLVCLLLLTLFLLSTIFIVSFGGNDTILKAILTIVFFALLSVTLLLLATIWSLGMLWYNKTIPHFLKELMNISIQALYPAINFLGRLLKYDKNTIRRVYADINNKLILSNEYEIPGENILMLTPHCIQKSFCPHKITTDIHNCRKCGQCCVQDLLALKEKYGVQFQVVTGGTLARKSIKDLNPKAIIAIACERDLVSGLQDVKNVPVIGIVNQRPEGPCVNTSVDLKEVEKAIRHFIKE